MSVPQPLLATATGDQSPVDDCAAVWHLPLTTLTKRSEFTRAASARRQSTGSFLLQARRRAEAETQGLVRVGFTCSKKVGNAVIRNRAKRRLREAARAVLTSGGQPGWDYVLVGRPGATVDRPFALLIADLRAALALIHARP